MLYIYNDTGEKWGLNLQEEATPIAAGMIDFHNQLIYYLIIILSIVCYFIGLRIINNKHIINNLRYFNHSTIVEFIWTIIPGIILILIAIPSFKLLRMLESEDLIKPELTVKVTGNQWFWNYQITDIDNLNVNFDSYTKSADELSAGELRLLDVDNRLFLPIHTPIRFLITAQDVIHSFFVPSFGIKTDAIPGRLNHTSSFILRPGLYYGQCAELCGQAHEKMSIVIQAVPYHDFILWLSSFID